MKNEMSQVASTILSQLGGPRIRAMIGATAFLFDEDSLTVKFQARAAKRANTLIVRLADNDLYEVQLWSCRGTTVKQTASVSGVDASSLRRVVETESQLRLSL